MRRKVIGENVEGGQREPGHPVRVRACAAPADGHGAAACGFQRLSAAGAIGERGQRACDAGQTQFARPALASGFLGEKRGDLGHLPQRAAVLADRQHHACAQRAADRRQPGPADRHAIGDLLRQPAAVVPADQHAIGRPGRAQVEHLAERQPGGHLHDRGPRGRASYRQQHRPRFGGGASRRVALRPDHREDRQLCKRLRVRQQSRASPGPAVAGMTVACGGQSPAAVHGVHQCARLPGYEPVRHLHHAHQAPEG
jgi:hypothetical protein